MDVMMLNEKLKSEYKFVTPDALEFHGISETNRARITDWMVQVFRALKLSAPSSFFAATYILDMYLVAKHE
jgi:Cyclin, N-terminal domain